MGRGVMSKSDTRAATLGDLKRYGDAFEKAMGQILFRLTEENGRLMDRIAALEGGRTAEAEPTMAKASKPRVILKSDAKPRVVIGAR